MTVIVIVTSSYCIILQLYQNYNHPPTVPEIYQSVPVLDFQEGGKEKSDTESESEATKQSEVTRCNLNTGVLRTSSAI